MKKIKIFIIFVWAMSPIFTDIYLPSIPNMAKYYATDIDSMQDTIVWYTLGLGIGALFISPLSDFVGRKPIIILSMLLAAAGCLLIDLTDNMHILFAARFIQGFALSGVAATTRALTKDLFPEKHTFAKINATLTFIIPVVTVLAPVIGGYIGQYFDWKVSFLSLFVYVFVFAIYTYFFIPETHNYKAIKSDYAIVKNYKQVIGNLRFMSYCLITALITSCLYAYIASSSDILEIDFKLSPEQFGFTNVIIAASFFITKFVNAQIIAKFTLEKIIGIGISFLCIAGILFFIGGEMKLVHCYFLLSSLFVMIVGVGFSSSNISSLAMSSCSSSIGAASGVFSSVQMLGASLGGYIVSMKYLQESSMLRMLGMLILIQAILGLLLFSFSIRSKQSSC